MKTIVKALVCLRVLCGAICAHAEATVNLTLQRRGADGVAVREVVAIDPAKTAVVIVDMWDKHWCKTYTARVANLVPRMNQTLQAVRKLGIQVVHAPSDVLGPYKDYPLLYRPARSQLLPA